MIKVGPTFETNGVAWDHQGKSEISEIYISCSQNCIHYIYFSYVENGTNVVFSEKIGGVQGSSSSMKTITLDYPSEYITGISGCIYDEVDRPDLDDYELEEFSTTFMGKLLVAIVFHTNKRKYGPYIPPDLIYDEYKPNFNYQVGGKFDGFYGTYKPHGIESIGFYVKPRPIVPKPPAADASPHQN